MAEPRTGRQQRRLTATVTDLEVVQQRAYLVGVARRSSEVPEAEVSLEELGLLTDTAGSLPVEAILLRRDSLDSATFIGKGKAAELAQVTAGLDIDVVVFDNELSPAQQRNLGNIFECDVVDRIAVILDIFAQHATSRSGMLQVELAQHRYRLPRLKGRGTEMSRLGGGIGTRGPGETQLETDRRRILERITKIEKELKTVDRSRATQRKARLKSDLPVAAIVGYTNAGKSTLFNALTEADVAVEDRLFATLDSTVRKLELPGGHHSLVSDTVGFVRRLPHQLVEAFRSTLEEAVDANLMVHVVDASDEHPDRQIEAVRQVLEEIGAADVPEQLVINKTDIADPVAVERLLQLHQGAVAVSALTGAGIEGVTGAMVAAFEATSVEIDLVVPYDKGDVLAAIHRIGVVLKEEYGDAGTHIQARIPIEDAFRFSEFAV